MVRVIRQSPLLTVTDLFAANGHQFTRTWGQHMEADFKVSVYSTCVLILGENVHDYFILWQ